jgi:RNA polymerase sigma-70 factor (ECF subfamily)
MLPELTDADLVELVKAAVERLPARRRNIFLLSRVEGWTNQQIADAYGIAVWRVRRHVRAAMHVLMLEVRDGKPPPFWRRW